MTERSIAVFGCGPAGLVAAQTAEALGAKVSLFSIPRRSYIAGAQFIHVPVPRVTPPDPDGMIRIVKRGTQEGYATKVYGNPKAPVSWNSYEETAYAAWNMRRVYDALWEIWEPRLVPITLTPALARIAATEGRVGGWGAKGIGGVDVDAVISTVPLNRLCLQSEQQFREHHFAEQTVHIKQVEGAKPQPDNVITYNGEREPAWYRHSYIFGTEAWEWSDVGRKPPIDGVVTITKPLATNCDCFERTKVPFLLTGRYGSWQKKTLVHDVPLDVVKLIDRMNL